MAAGIRLTVAFLYLLISSYYDTSTDYLSGYNGTTGGHNRALNNVWEENTCTYRTI